MRRFPGGGPARAVLGSLGLRRGRGGAQDRAARDRAAPGVVAFEGAYHGLAPRRARRDLAPALPRALRARGCPRATVFARFGDADDALRAARASRAADRRRARRADPGARRRARSRRRGFLARAARSSATARAGCWSPTRSTPDSVAPAAGSRASTRASCPISSASAKGLASGMPISACVGRAEVMDAWPPSRRRGAPHADLPRPPARLRGRARHARGARGGEARRARGRASAPRARAPAHAARRDCPAIARRARASGCCSAIECDAPETRTPRLRARARARRDRRCPSGDDGRVLAVTRRRSRSSRALLDAALDAALRGRCDGARRRSGARRARRRACCAWMREPDWTAATTRASRRWRSSSSPSSSSTARPIARFCEGRGRDAAIASRAGATIPAVPTGAFKELALALASRPSAPCKRLPHQRHDRRARAARSTSTRSSSTRPRCCPTFERHVLPDLAPGERAALR